jgi:hypothetical protein
MAGREGGGGLSRGEEGDCSVAHYTSLLGGDDTNRLHLL